MSKYTRRGILVARIPDVFRLEYERQKGRPMDRIDVEAYFEQLKNNPQFREASEALARNREERNRLIGITVGAINKRRERPVRAITRTMSPRLALVHEERLCHALAVARFHCDRSGTKWAPIFADRKRLMRFERANPEWLEKLIGRLLEIEVQNTAALRQ